VSNLLIGTLGVLVLLVTLFLRVPIGVALALVGVCGYAAIDGWNKASPPSLGALRAGERLLALGGAAFHPDGRVASRGNMAKEMFDAANGLFSGVRGALANATVGACALFGAICGSSIATAPPSPRWRSRKCAATATSPPSPPARSPPPARSTSHPALGADSHLCTCGRAIARQAVCRLLHPGFLLAGSTCSPSGPWPGCGELGAARAGHAPRRAPTRPVGMWKLVLLFFFAVFGIYLGWFSPTEAAAMAAFVAILIAFFTRAMGWRA